MIVPKSHLIYLFPLFGLAMGYIIYHLPHPHIPPQSYYFQDQTRYLEMTICTICFTLFGWLFLSEKGAWFKGYFFEFYSGNVQLKRKNNIFYSWLMLFTASIILCFNIHLLNKNHTDPGDISSALKVWEIASYWVTTLYTFWFWTQKDRGVEILKKLKDRNVETGIFLGAAILILLTFAIAHTYLFYVGTYDNFIKANEPLMSLGLIVFVYIIFIIINNKVITHAKDPDVKKDIRTMHIYIDRPTAAIFVVLFTFAIYARYIGCLVAIENFFSGAIAFELILSSIVWSNTNTF